MKGKEKLSGRPMYVLPLAALAVCFAAALALLSFTSSEPQREPNFSDLAPRPARPEGAPVRIGLVDFNYSSTNSREINASIERLKDVLAPTPVIATRYKAEDLDQDVKAGKIDFFVASSGFYRRMAPYGARALATVVNRDRPDPNKSSGAVFIVLASSPITKISDMQGKRLSASYPTAFNGYRIAMAELADLGYDYETFFRSTIFVGGPHIHKIMHPLIDGDADVAIIPACTYEEWSKNDQAQFRLIGASTDTGIHCWSSTTAYPGHTLAVMNGVQPEVAKRVVETLLSMKRGDRHESWSVATDFTAVDRAYRLLKIGPYAYLREPTFKHWLREHRTSVLILLILVGALSLHAWRSDVLVLRRTEELEAESEARERSSRELAAMNQRMEQTHKATLVGQLSSMIAHELAQPLSAISYYLEGAMELVKRQHDETGLLASSLEKIRVQTDRMGAIVGKVRSYAKSDAKRDDRVDFSGTLTTALSELRVKGIGNVKVASSVPVGLAVRGDPLEIELLLWNLLKNATEAALGTEHPEIEITGQEKDGIVSLQIGNSGPVMTEEDVKNLDSPLQSKKPGGTGLGLHIAESIAEATGGGISLKPRTPDGLTAMLHLPSFRS